MKFSKVAILSALSLGSGAAARSNRFRLQDDGDKKPIQERSRVTAFTNTDDGLIVECWEIGDFLPEAKHTKGSVRAVSFANKPDVTVYSFEPSTTIFSTGHTSGLKTSGVDFSSGGNLFTVKDGLILINLSGQNNDDLRATEEEVETHVFADINGDDWFYFEDSTIPNDDDSVESCEKSHSKSRAGESGATASTVSGSETTLINFKFSRTPPHKVLHPGRCNFAGLATPDNSNQD